MAALHRLSLGLGMMLAAASSAASAQCWSEGDAGLARARALQAKLMVASTRCEAAGIALASDYDAFLDANRSALAAVNQRLKARFWTAYGREEGQKQLEAFTGGLARQPREAAGAESCARYAALTRDALANAGSVSGLVAVAERSGAGPKLPGGLCSAASPERPVKVVQR